MPLLSQCHRQRQRRLSRTKLAGGRISADMNRTGTQRHTGILLPFPGTLDCPSPSGGLKDTGAEGEERAPGSELPTQSPGDCILLAFSRLQSAGGEVPAAHRVLALLKNAIEIFLKREVLLIICISYILYT